MQYTVSMSSRMIAITALCLFLLCILLFLLGIELGKRFAQPVDSGAAPAVAAPALPASPASAMPPSPAVSPAAGAKP